MGYREVHRIEIGEVVRRWQMGESQRAIAQALGLSRDTVAKYLRQAAAAGVQQDAPPADPDLFRALANTNRPGPAPVASAARTTALVLRLALHDQPGACTAGWNMTLGKRRARRTLDGSWLTPSDLGVKPRRCPIQPGTALTWRSMRCAIKTAGARPRWSFLTMGR